MPPGQTKGEEERGEKTSIEHNDIDGIQDILDDIQNSMYSSAASFLKENTIELDSYKDLQEKLSEDNYFIKVLSECSGHTGIAGGQYLDLNYERKKIKRKKIIDMQIKKTGKLFAFCCIAPALISNKNQKVLKFFEKIGYEIGLLFQITDDLIDYKGITKKAGKKTKKDQKKGIITA